MDNYSFKLHGGTKLNGDFHIQGSKNEAFEVLCACLLTKQNVTIYNIPQIIDIVVFLEIFELIGVSINKIDDSTYTFNACNLLSPDEIDIQKFKSLSQSLRGVVLLIGPWLSRFNKAIMSIPGGDKIGSRKLTTHFEGLKKMNIDTTYNQELGIYICQTDHIQSNYVLLEEKSVTATANIILTSVLVEGLTTIYNAACEPHIQELCKMLNSMGAKISGIGSNKLIIEGVESLHGLEYTIKDDTLEIGSIISLAALTESKINLICKNINPQYLEPILLRFNKIGINASVINENNILIEGEHDYYIKNPYYSSVLTIDDAPWPGFPTDLLGPLLVSTIQAKGSVLIHEKLYESRLFFVDNLVAMGARIIICDPHRVYVDGINRQYKLKGTIISTPDIRAGMSLLIAALSAEGQTIVNKANIITRGYQNIVSRLQNIGADIEQISMK